MAATRDDRERPAPHRPSSQCFTADFAHPVCLATVAIAYVDVPPNGYADHTEHRFAGFDQRDVDGELAVPADEFLRAVERIDQPITLPTPPLFEGRRFGFLGDHRYVRRQFP